MQKPAREEILAVFVLSSLPQFHTVILLINFRKMGFTLHFCAFILHKHKFAVILYY